MSRAPIYGGEKEMSMDVHIAPDLDDEEEVHEWIKTMKRRKTKRVRNGSKTMRRRKYNNSAPSTPSRR